MNLGSNPEQVRPLWPRRTVVNDRTEAVWQIHIAQIADLWCKISALFQDVAGLTLEAVDAIDQPLQQGLKDLLELRMGNYMTPQEDIMVESLVG